MRSTTLAGVRAARQLHGHLYLLNNSGNLLRLRANRPQPPEVQAQTLTDWSRRLRVPMALTSRADNAMARLASAALLRLMAPA